MPVCRRWHCLFCPAVPPNLAPRRSRRRINIPVGEARSPPVRCVAWNVRLHRAVSSPKRWITSPHGDTYCRAEGSKRTVHRQAVLDTSLTDMQTAIAAYSPIPLHPPAHLLDVVCGMGRFLPHCPPPRRVGEGIETDLLLRTSHPSSYGGDDP